jgi:DNA-binding YbaB/EbfC family protein
LSEDEQAPGPAEQEPAETSGVGFPSMPSFGGGLGELFGEARAQVERAAEESRDVHVLGRAGGGAVEIELTGNLDVVSVKIDPGVLDGEDVSMLEDLVMAALRDALAGALEIREQAAVDLLPPGLDLGAMVSSLLGPGAGGVPDLSEVDFGGLDFGEIVGNLFGGPEADEPEDDSPEDEQP